MPSKPVFSDADKKAIRKKTEKLCEECRIAQGYKNRHKQGQPVKGGFSRVRAYPCIKGTLGYTLGGSFTAETG